jgi:2-polyprenyl-6-methoxyphenol hydroxylase-like FAD-dependent oxidoreductase
MPTQPKIAVIGGSLVGPTAELALRSHGLTNVQTYEAMKTPHPQSGGVMGLRDQSINILRGAGVDVDSTVALESRDTVSFDMDGGTEPRQRGRSSLPGLVTSWDKLHAALGERVDVQLSHHLLDIGTDGKRAQLTFKGHTAEADLVIFADGRKSTGRALLDPNRHLMYSGYTMWRGLIEATCDMAVEGFSRFYDTPRGVLFSITEPILNDGRMYWELSTNLSQAAFERIVGKSPTERAFLLPNQVTPLIRKTVDALATAYLPAQFRDIVHATTEIMGIPINDLPLPERTAWQLGNAHAVLVGDAAQTVRLQTGWGLNAGIGQVNCLAERLAGGIDLDEALCSWQRESIDAIGPWVELGRRRAAATNLGTYWPVRPGYTAVPSADVWAPPEWVVA